MERGPRSPEPNRSAVDRPLVVALVAMHVLAVARPVDVLFPVDPWAVGRMIVEGRIPYRDFQFEYPPLSALAFVLPGLVPRAAATTVLALQALALEVVAALAIRHRPRALRRFGAMSLLLFPFLAGGFDAFPMAALAVSTAMLAAGRRSGWAVVAAGTMMKVTPGVAWVWCRHHLAAAAAALAVTVAVLVAPVALARDRNDDWLSYNLNRGVQVESVAATTTWLARQVTGAASTYEYRFKAFEIDGAGPAAAAWTGLGALAMAWILLRARGRPPWALALLAVDVFLVSSRVLSPQFLAWTAPLAAVVGGRVFVAHLAMGLLTVASYTLVSGSESILAVAALRNLVLVGTTAWGLWQLRSPKVDDSRGGGGGGAGAGLAATPGLSPPA